MTTPVTGRRLQKIIPTLLEFTLSKCYRKNLHQQFKHTIQRQRFLKTSRFMPNIKLQVGKYKQIKVLNLLYALNRKEDWKD